MVPAGSQTTDWEVESAVVISLDCSEIPVIDYIAGYCICHDVSERHSQIERGGQGDVITTGTPKGVGLSRKPPRYLKAGDRVRVSIEGLGTQRQRVVAHPSVRVLRETPRVRSRRR